MSNITVSYQEYDRLCDLMPKLTLLPALIQIMMKQSFWCLHRIFYPWLSGSWKKKNVFQKMQMEKP